jgi:hypothetical protein
MPQSVFTKANFLSDYLADKLEYARAEFQSELDDVYAYTEKVFESQKPLGHRKTQIDARIEAAKKVIRAPIVPKSDSMEAVFPSGNGTFTRIQSGSVQFQNPLGAPIESYDPRDPNPTHSVVTLQDVIRSPSVKNALESKGMRGESTVNNAGIPVYRLSNSFSSFDFSYGAGSLMYGRADADSTQTINSAVGIRAGSKTEAFFVGAAQIVGELLQKSSTEAFKNVTHAEHFGRPLQEGERAYNAGLTRVKYDDMTSTAYLTYRGGKNVAIPKSTSEGGYQIGGDAIDQVLGVINDARKGSSFDVNLTPGKKVSQLQDLHSYFSSALPSYSSGNSLDPDNDELTFTGVKNPKHGYATRGGRGDTGNRLLDLSTGEVRRRMTMLGMMPGEDGPREGNEVKVRYASSRFMFGEGVALAAAENLVTLTRREEVGQLDYYHNVKPGDVFTRDGRAPLFMPEGGRLRAGEDFSSTRSNIPFFTGTQVTVHNVGKPTDPETGEILKDKPNMLVSIAQPWERSEFKQSSGKSVLVGIDKGHEWLQEREGFKPDVLYPMQDVGVRARALQHDLWLSQGGARDYSTLSEADRKRNLVSSLYEAGRTLGMDASTVSNSFVMDEQGRPRFRQNKTSFDLQMQAANDYFKGVARTETYSNITLAENEFYGTVMGLGEEAAKKTHGDSWSTMKRADQHEVARMAGVKALMDMGVTNVRFQKYGEQTSSPINQVPWKSNLGTSTGTFVFDQKVLTVDAYVPANTTPVDTTGSATLSPEFVGLSKKNAPWASKALSALWGTAMGKNKKARLLGFLEGGGKGYEEVDIHTIDTTSIVQSAIDEVDPEGRGWDEHNTIVQNRLYKAVLDQTAKAIGKKSLKVDGGVWSPARYAASAMQSIDHTNDDADGYGVLMAKTIMTAAHIRQLQSLGMGEEDPAVQELQAQLGGLSVRADRQAQLMQTGSGEFISSASTTRVPALAGMMAGFRGMPEDTVIANPDDVRKVLISQGMKGKELSAAIRQMESTGLQGLSVMYPSSNTMQSMLNTTYRSPKWADENIPGFQGLKVPQGGSIASMTVAQAMAKDADGDRIAGFLFPGVSSAPQRRSIVDAAWSNRGFEIHSAFAKDATSAGAYYAMSGTVPDSEKKKLSKFRTLSTESREQKKLMGTDFNAFVRGFRDTSDIIANKMSQGLAFAVADMGQSVYQGSLDGDPMKGNAMSQMRGFLAEGYWFKGRAGGRGISAGFGDFDIMTDDLAKKMWRGYGDERTTVNVNPPDSYFGERDPQEYYRNEAKRRSPFRNQLGQAAQHILGVAVMAPMASANYGGEGLRFDDPSQFAKGSLLASHARTMVPMGKAEDETEVRRMAEFLWKMKDKINESTDPAEVGRAYLEHQGLVNKKSSDRDVWMAAEKAAFGDDEKTYEQTLEDRAFLPFSMSTRMTHRTIRKEVERDYFGEEADHLIDGEAGWKKRMPKHWGRDAEVGEAVDASIRLSQIAKGKGGDTNPLDRMRSLIPKTSPLSSHDEWSQMLNVLSGREPDLLAGGGSLDPDEVTIVGEMGPEVIYKGKVYSHATYLQMFGGKSGRQVRDHFANRPDDAPRMNAPGGSLTPQGIADWMAEQGKYESWMIDKVRGMNSLPVVYGLNQPQLSPTGRFVAGSDQDYQMNGGTLHSLMAGSKGENPILQAGIGITNWARSTSHTELGREHPGQVDANALEQFVIGKWIGGADPLDARHTLGEVRAAGMGSDTSVRLPRRYSGPRPPQQTATNVPPPMAPPPPSNPPGGGGSSDGGRAGMNAWQLGSAFAKASNITERLSRDKVVGALQGYVKLARIGEKFDLEGRDVADLDPTMLKQLSQSAGAVTDVSLALRQLRAEGEDVDAFIKTVSAGDLKYENALEMFNTGSSVVSGPNGKLGSSYAGVDITGLANWGDDSSRRVDPDTGLTMGRSGAESFAGRVRAESGFRSKVKEENAIMGFRNAGIRAGTQAFLEGGFDKANFGALVDRAERAQPGESSAEIGALSRIFAGIKKGDDLGELQSRVGIPMADLERGQATLQFQQMRGVKGSDRALNAESDVSAIRLNSLVKSLGSIDEAFGKLGQTTKMLTDEKRAYGQQLQHVVKNFEGMNKALEQISAKEELGISLSPNERMSKGLMTEGPLAERLNQYNNTKSLIESDMAGLENDRVYRQNKTHGEIQAEIMDSLMGRGTRGRKMREGSDFRENVQQEGLDIGFGQNIKDLGTVKALGQGMRFAAGMSGAMFGMTMAKYNLVEPANQLVQGYLENQQRVSDSLVGFGGINRAQTANTDMDLGQRRMASGAQFQLGMGEQVMRNFSPVFQMGGGAAAGRMAGDIASVVAPGMLGSMMMSSLSMPALAAPVGLAAMGLSAGLTFASKVNNPTDITNVVTSSRTQKKGLLEEIGFLFEAAQAFPAAAFGDPEKNERAYQAGVLQNQYADSFATGDGNVRYLDEGKFRPEFQGADRANLRYKGFEAVLAGRFSPEQIGQYYSAYQTYGLTSNVDTFANQMSTSIARGIDPMQMHAQVAGQMGVNPLSDTNTFLDLLSTMNGEQMGDPATRGAFGQAVGLLSNYSAAQNQIRASQAPYAPGVPMTSPGSVFSQAFTVATGVNTGTTVPEFMNLPENLRGQAAQIDLSAQEQESFYLQHGGMDLNTGGVFSQIRSDAAGGSFGPANRSLMQDSRRRQAYQSAIYGNYGDISPQTAFDVGNTIAKAPSMVGNVLQGALGGDPIALTMLSKTQAGADAGFNFNLIDLETGQSPYARQIDMAEYDQVKKNAELGGADMSRFPTEASFNGKGMIARVQAHKDQMHGFTMASYGIQASQARMQFAFMTGGTRELDAQGFAVGGDIGKAIGREGFNPGNGMGMWQVQDAMTGIQREKQDWGMQQQLADLDAADKDKAMQIRHFNEKWDSSWNWLQTSSKYNMKEMNIGRKQSLVQRGWAGEDMQMNQQVADLQFGWQQEDFSRNIRYARGRERVDMQREQGRGNTMFQIQQTQRDKEEDRFKEQNKWQDERFDREKDFFKLSKKHSEDEMKMEKRHFEERMGIEQEKMDRARKNYEKEMAWLMEQRGLEDQNRLLERQQSMYMHDFQMASIGVAMAAAEAAKKFQDEMDQWEVGENVTNSMAKLQVAFGEIPGLITKIKDKVDWLRDAILALPGGSDPEKTSSVESNDPSIPGSFAEQQLQLLLSIRDQLAIIAANPTVNADLTVNDKSLTIQEIEDLIRSMI